MMRQRSNLASVGGAEPCGTPVQASEPDEASAQSDTGRAETIITAGYALLSVCGLDGLTVRAVLTATGLNRRAFYEHFADKDQLMLAIFARSIKLLTAQCVAGTAAIPDPIERLKFMIDYLVVSDVPATPEYAEKLRRGAALCREHMRLAEARPADLQNALRPLIRLLAEQLAAGMALGTVRREDPEQLANLMYSLVSTTVHATVLAQEQRDSSPVDRSKLADQIWQFTRRGIAP